ncbi:HEAT repeat domain-containing protein [Kitasatospora sp. NPDC096147]|uniref:HEAT repeat domain-containing protein n=1 Tax=Kitasatospora sp. NPDC096147 TaxID=3364093 RepID=UPI00380EACB6
MPSPELPARTPTSAAALAAVAPPDPAAVLAGTDWAALDHAYGPAESTAEDLLGLLDEDPEVQAGSLGALEMSVLHQGSLYTATAPAALFIAGILSDPRTLVAHEGFFPWDDRVRPLRVALLEWLGEFAHSAGLDREEWIDPDDPEEAGVLAAVTACQAVRPQVLVAVRPFLDDADPGVREAALGVVTHLLGAGAEADGFAARQAAADRLEHIARTPGGRRERAAALLTLAQWGRDTAAQLDDPDPAVRTCAALGTADPAAVEVLLAALADPAVVDGWFDEPLPQTDGWFRFTVLHGLLDRADSFERVLPAALALVPRSSQYTVDREWGPLLAFAFAEPHAPEAPLTPAQHAFLAALVDHDPCWGRIGNRDVWLRGAGLPTSREDLRALLR